MQVAEHQGKSGRPGVSGVSSILMAAALSNLDRRAMEQAMSLSAQHGAQLLFLHVMSEEVPENVRERVERAARQEIEAAVATASSVDRTNIDIQVTTGKGHEEIIIAADRIGADLIVLGMHQKTKDDAGTPATTIDQVIRYGRQPVLVVTERDTDRYDKVMIGADFSVYSRCAIQTSLAFVPGAELDIVHAFQVPFSGFMSGDETRRAVQEQHAAELRKLVDREMELLVSSAALHGWHLESPNKIVKQGEPVAVLSEEVARLQPDLLVLGTHGRVGLANALLGSVAEAFLNAPPCDVLAVKAW